MTLQAPFPWFGGKSRVADLVWERFGDTPNYVEPFAGSLAVLLARPTDPGTETVNDRDCVAPDTRILRADLKWARAREVRVGDRLVGFDEHNGPAVAPGLRAPSRYRRLAHATVTAVRVMCKPCYRLAFDDGTVVVASANHLWLGGSHASGGRGWRWVKTESMVCNRRTQRSWVLKVADVVEREDGWEAGWLAGMFDGEGSLRVGPGLRACLAQNEGATLEQAEHLLAARGFTTERTGERRCRLLHVKGGMAETLALLMRLRPERLIAKLPDRLGEVSLYGRSHRAVGLVAKEFLGEQTVIAIETDSRTFIAEGLASHNCHLSNFWRAVQADPEAVARWADWPVNEADLHARHRWLVGRDEFRERMKSDPDFYDPKIAGWWVWGLCGWIGTGWCRERRDGAPSQQLPHLGDAGQGLNRRDPSRQLPHLGNAGMGLHRKLPHLGDAGRGTVIAEWLTALSARLARVRVACGDWTRVLGPSVTERHGTTGVFLDPPYSDDEHEVEYAAGGDVAAAVRAWAIENGDNPALRIVLCGYEGEHEMPESWAKVSWKARGGYGSQGDGQGRENAGRERIWFSPACISQPKLWDLWNTPGMDTAASAEKEG